MWIDIIKINAKLKQRQLEIEKIVFFLKWIFKLLSMNRKKKFVYCPMTNADIFLKFGAIEINS